MMYTVVDTSTGRTSTVTFDKLNSMAGDGLDESFFTEAFTAHTLDGKNGKLLVLEDIE